MISGSLNQKDDGDAKRVFLLEDDGALLRMLTGYLREQGYFVMGTDDPEQALQNIDGSPWDLVITDGVLETCSGEDFAARVATSQPNLPLVMITGSIRAIQDPALFQGILHKPFRRSEFLEFVEGALERSASTPN